jgi:hypothetical protein
VSVKTNTHEIPSPTQDTILPKRIFRLRTVVRFLSDNDLSSVELSPTSPNEEEMRSIFHQMINVLWLMPFPDTPKKEQVSNQSAGYALSFVGKPE